MLQDLARDIQRQVIGIDNAAHKAQPGRQQLFRVIHDKHPPHIQFYAMPLLPVPQIKRRAGGDIQQRGIFQLALDLAVNMGQRRLEIVRDMLVEFLIFLRLDVFFIAAPQCRGAVYGLLPGRGLDFLLLFALLARFLLGLFGHDDRQGNMIGIAGDDAAQAIAVQKFIHVIAQMQDHLRAAPRPVKGLYGIVALPVGTPAHAFGPAKAGPAADHLHLFRHDKTGIKTHAELPDQARILRFIAGQGLEELFRAGFGDGAQMLDHLGPRQADAVVDHGDRLQVFIEFDPDLQFGLAFIKAVVPQGLKPQLVGRIGGVGDEFAQKDFLVAVQGMNHEAQ